MRRFVLSSVAAASFAFASSFAVADTVKIDNFTFPPASVTTISSVAPGIVFSVTDLPTGQYSGSHNGSSFVTYCTELTQPLAFGTTYTDFSVVNGVTAWGASKSMLMNQLISAALPTYPFDADSSALVQAAIWEILFETSGTLDFGSGTFQISSSNAATQTMLSTGIDWAGIMSFPVSYQVDLLASPTAQDLLVITAVPEPSTYALLLAGLAGIGFVSRRRARRT